MQIRCGFFLRSKHFTLHRFPTVFIYITTLKMQNRPLASGDFHTFLLWFVRRIIEFMNWIDANRIGNANTMGHIKTAHSIAVECKFFSRSFRSATAFCSQCTCELDYIGWNSRKFNLKAHHSLQDVSYNECHLEFDSHVGGDFPGLEIFTTIFFRNYPYLCQHFYSAIEPISWRYCKEMT